MSKVTKSRIAAPADPESPQTSKKTKREKGSKRRRGTEIIQVLNEGSTGTVRLRYDVPSVARHCARVIVLHNMDYLRATEYLLHDYLKDPSVQIQVIAHNLEKSEQVQKCIEEELSVHGLDDSSKEVYVREIWDWFRHGSENLKMKAAGILGRGFIAEKVETSKPEELPLQGLGDAVKSMLGSATDDTTIKEPAPRAEIRPDVGGEDAELATDFKDGHRDSSREKATRTKLPVRDVKSN